MNGRGGTEDDSARNTGHRSGHGRGWRGYGGQVATRRTGRQGREHEWWGDVAALVGACQAHGALEILRIVELDIDADVLRQASHEELRLLIWGEAPRVRHARLELLVRHDVGWERQTSQICQVIRAERQPETLMAKALEFLPNELAGIALQDVVPLLRNTHEVEGGEPHLVALRGALGAEEPIIAVEPAERIILAIVGGKEILW